MAERDELNMERSADEIRKDIAAKRETISDTVDKLGERLQQTLNWREFVGNHPYATIGTAAAAGFLMAGLFRRRPTPADRVRDAVAETVEDLSHNIRDSVQKMFWKTAGPGMVKGALYSFAAKTAMDFVRQKAVDLASERDPKQYAETEQSTTTTPWADFDAHAPSSSKRPS